jgi:hypothetical protein
LLTRGKASGNIGQPILERSTAEVCLVDQAAHHASVIRTLRQTVQLSRELADVAEANGEPRLATMLEQLADEAEIRAELLEASAEARSAKQGARAAQHATAIEALAARLEAFNGEQPALLREPAPQERAARWARRLLWQFRYLDQAG